MCPPALPFPLGENHLFCNDEQIIWFLSEYTPGSDLPNQVLADSSPYQYPPSTLPDGFWYLVHSNEKKEFDHGYWKAKGEACKIYSSSMIIGWRTTLEYFEGQVPHEQKTDWIMQEYRITHEKTCEDKDEEKESRLLCRVIFSGQPSSKIETQPEKGKTIIKSENRSLATSIDLTLSISYDRRGSKGEYEVGGASSELGDNRQQDSNVRDCYSPEDFIELNDLMDVQLYSFSSPNSSSSKLSDEYFDSSAHLRAFENEEYNYLQAQGILQMSPSYGFFDDVVLPPDAPRSQSTGSQKRGVDEESLTLTSVLDKLFSENEVMAEHTAKRHTPESRNEGTPSASGEVTSLSVANPTNGEQSEEKKAGDGKKKKKLKKERKFGGS